MTIAISTLAVPNTISNGIVANGNNVGANFDAIETWAAEVEVALEGNVTEKLVAGFSRTSDIVISLGAGVDTGTVALNIENETNDFGAFWSSGNTISVSTAGLYLVGLSVVTKTPSGAGEVSLSTSLSINGGGTENLSIANQTGASTKAAAKVVWLLAGGSNALTYYAGNGVGGSADLTIDKVTLVIAKLADIPSV
jgi:hypothetical protein